MPPATESQVRIAMNTIQQTAADVGTSALPIVANLAKTVEDLSAAWASLPAPTRSGAVALVGIVGTAALVVGGTMKAVTAIAEMKTSLNALGVTSNLTGAKLKSAAVQAVALSAALIAFNAYQANAAQELDSTVTRVEDLASAMADAQKQSKTVNLDDTFKFSQGLLIKDEVNGVGDALRRALDPRSSTRWRAP